MLSFQDFLQETSQETDAMKAIRNGLGIDKDFWDDFIMLLNNAEALSDLLKVPVEKIATWRDLINKSLERVHQADGEVVPKDKKRLLKTGLPEGL